VPRPRAPRSIRGRRTARRSEPDGGLPLVEIVLGGVATDDWVTALLRAQKVPFRLLTCRGADRGRRRLVRLFEVGASGEMLSSLVRRLRGRLSDRDIAATPLGPERSLLRVSVPIPAGCAAIFDLGDLCISCPFAEPPPPSGRATWKVLVPQIVDARRLISAARLGSGADAFLVRAGAYRPEWGLTGRQERAIRTALELGYFDYPRRADLAKVAERLGVGRSTALELLRKATTKVAADRFLGGTV
jgi:DNA binding protein with HTH domain